MKEEFHILITDRNPHVREYLKREMVAEGYHVRIAKSGQDILEWIYHREPIDLLILDPDLPDVDKLSVFQKLQDRIPSLPVVVHTFASDYSQIADIFTEAVFVEKCGSSVEGLKQIVGNILENISVYRSQQAQKRESRNSDICDEQK